MIRFGLVLSAVLTAIGLLVAGVIAGSLMLVDVSIGVAVLAGLLLLSVVLIWRREIFAAPAAADPRKAGKVAVGQIPAAGEATAERPHLARVGPVQADTVLADAVQEYTEQTGTKLTGAVKAGTAKVGAANARGAAAGAARAGSVPSEVGAAQKGVAAGLAMAGRASAGRERPGTRGQAKPSEKQVTTAGEQHASATVPGGPAAAGPGVPESERPTAAPESPSVRTAGAQAGGVSEQRPAREPSDSEHAAPSARPAAVSEAAEPGPKAGATSSSREELAYRPSRFALRAQERAAQRAAQSMASAQAADAVARSDDKTAPAGARDGSARETPGEPPKPSEPPKPTQVQKSADEPRPARRPGPAETSRPTQAHAPVEAVKPVEAAESGEAAEPGQAAEPVEAVKPAEPVKPAAPAVPAEPLPSPEEREPDPSSQPAKDDEPGADDTLRSVRVVPGIARYHRADCILIRFLAPDDLEVMTRQAAAEGGCVPCKACQPDKSAAEVSVG